MRPMDALDEVRAGEALIETTDDIVFDVYESQISIDWDDCVGTKRDVYARFAEALRVAGYVIVREP